MLIYCVLVKTPGLMHDADIIRAAFRRHDFFTQIRFMFIYVPSIAEGWEGAGWSNAEAEKFLYVDEKPDCVVFLENIVNHSALLAAKIRILIPNPEQLNNNIAKLVPLCTHMWHKSLFSFNRLSAIFPFCKHEFIGFTSIDPSSIVNSYETFIHAKGNVWTNRNTELILECWRLHPEWPSLLIILYGDENDYFNNISRECKNVNVLNGWKGRSEYINLLKTSGIHICTSSHEGFGHYINESRAMQALVITTDAPPMNELIDDNSGILIEPSSVNVNQMGFAFHLDEKSFENAIQSVLTLDLNEREALGKRARERYCLDSERFFQLSENVLSELGFS
jgi:hypothetical protein